MIDFTPEKWENKSVSKAAPFLKGNKMKKKTVSVIASEFGVIVKANVAGRKVTVTPSSRSGLRGFGSHESAKRAWRKYASRHNVSNYEYKLVG